MSKTSYMYRKEYIYRPNLFLTQVFLCFQQLKENMMTNLIMGGVANNEDKSGKENIIAQGQRKESEILTERKMSTMVLLHETTFQ